MGYCADCFAVGHGHRRYMFDDAVFFYQNQAT
jgi:hypothetical protein